MAARKNKQTSSKQAADPFEDALPEPGLLDMAPDVGREKLPERTKLDKRKLALDWKIVEAEYIYGWVTEDRETRTVKRIYPTMRDLAERHRCNHGTIGKRAKEGNWVERRQFYIAQLRREIDQEVARARKLSLGELSGGLDTFLSNFLLRIAGNGVETTKISDFEKAARLKVWLVKEMQGMNQNNSGGIPLEELQRLHAEQEKQRSSMSSSTAGMIPGREERERQRDADADGVVSVLSDERKKRDGKAAREALAHVKRTHRTGWDVCDSKSA